MAITESRMAQLIGPYADLNKSNMLVGEMAVPSDHVPVVRNGVNSWEDLLTSQSAGEIIALSETMEQQITDFEQLEIDKVGINDSSATLTQAYSGSKTQGLIDEVNTNLGLKASQSSLDLANSAIMSNTSVISTHTSQITSLASGSPKGIYATVLALTTAYPTGNINTYVVTADGGWYYWNGSIWTKGGTYQSTGISEKAISFKHIKDSLIDALNGTHSVSSSLTTNWLVYTSILPTDFPSASTITISFKVQTTDIDVSSLVAYAGIPNSPGNWTPPKTINTSDSTVKEYEFNSTITYSAGVSGTEGQSFAIICGVNTTSAMSDIFIYDVSVIFPDSTILSFGLANNSYNGNAILSASEYSPYLSLTTNDVINPIIDSIIVKTDTTEYNGFHSLISGNTGHWLLINGIASGTLSIGEILNIKFKMQTSNLDVNTLISFVGAPNAGEPYSSPINKIVSKIDGVYSYEANYTVDASHICSLGDTMYILCGVNTAGTSSDIFIYDVELTFPDLSTSYLTSCTRNYQNTSIVTNSKYSPYSIASSQAGLAFNGLKIVCIGDSLTEGDYGSVPAGTKNVHGENYPYFIQQYFGGTIVNKGSSGATTLTYYENQFPLIDFSDVDNVIIMIGTNGGLTDTIATDCIGNDYNLYASTNTGTYCKMIENIFEQTDSNIQILLCTIPRTDQVPTNQELINYSVVKQIAERYHLALIDVYNEAGFSGFVKTVMQPIDGTHFGLIGYKKLGTFIGNQTKSKLSLR